MAERSGGASPGACLVAQPDRDRVLDHPTQSDQPADFADLATLADRLCRFEHRYNQTARPFDWRFTRDDLAKMLHRVDTTPIEAATVLAA